MKMTKEHYNFLLNAAKEVGKDVVKQHRQFILEEGKAKDIEMRLRWDLFYKIRDKSVPYVYNYLNDSHIDTALKSIMKELGYATD
jgi:hypothetical protein